MPSTKSKATQEFVPIKEIRDNLVILENGSLQAILMISSTNFALKSNDEQKAILSQFQNFLNSLDFSIQISVQSRELDIRPYIALLENQYEQQTKELLKIQTREYIEFIKNFINSVNVMSKSFFVTIPYGSSVFSGSTNKITGFFKNLAGMGDEKTKDQTSFEEDRAQLEQRIAVVQDGVKSLGLEAVLLENEELIELFYKIFNPGESEKPMQLEEQVKQNK